MVKQFNTEQLTDRFEDRRDIKNLMGIYSQHLLLNKEKEMFDFFWAKEQEDICLGFNDGWFSGKEAIRDYYAKVAEATKAKGELIMKLFPDKFEGKTIDDVYGIGPLKIESLNNAVIEIATDGKTAKYFGICIGLVTDVDEHGPVSNWVYSYWCADFIREGDEGSLYGGWKLWHMTILDDINAPAGSKWGVKDAAYPYPELEEFAPLKALDLPKPNGPCVLREQYHGMRPFARTPALPVPYDTFADTFSYGM